MKGRLRKNGRRAALPVVALLALLWFPGDGAAQWPPDSLTNLQVLPEDIAFGELMNTMGGFTRALGVRCSTCHVGEEGQPLATYDFAADDKATKVKARAMLRMVSTINGDHLAGLAERNDPPVRVECVTCHRGNRVPRTLQDELRIAYEGGGVEAVIERYRELRDEYYGRAAYDFGTVPLADIGGELQQAGALEAAETVHALNVEMNPGEWFPQRQHATVAVYNAFLESPEAGEARYRELKAEYDPRALPNPVVNQIGYSILPQDPEAAVVLFRLNAESNPGNWNVWDSLGEGLEAAGRTGEAIEAYRQSLELNPNNANARERLEALDG